MPPQGTDPSPVLQTHESPQPRAAAKAALGVGKNILENMCLWTVSEGGSWLAPEACYLGSTHVANPLSRIGISGENS